MRRTTLSAEDAAAAGSDDAAAGRGRRGGGHADRQRGGARRADGRACRSCGRAQPVRAVAARRRRPPRPAGAADRRCRARGGRDRRAHRRACRSRAEKRVLAEEAAGAVEAAEAGRAGRRKGRRGVARRTRRRCVRRCRRRRPSWRASRPRRARWPRSSMRRPATCFPAVLEQIKVERGYETALGAALGEDLDVPLDPRRAGPLGRQRCRCRAIRRLPRGAVPLASVVQAPPQLARRLAQIGIVEAADGARLSEIAGARPAPGQPRRRAVALGRAGGRAPTRRPPPRSAWRRRTGSPSSTPKPSPRRPGCAPPSRRWPTPSARCARARRPSAQRGKAGATRSTGSTRRATRCRRRRRRQASLPPGVPRWPKRCRGSAKRMPKRRARSTEAERGAGRGARSVGAAGRVRAPCGRRSQRDRATLADARASHDGLKREAEQRTRRAGGDRRRARQLDFARRERRPPDRSARRAAQRCARRARSARRRARRDRRAASRR